MLFPQHHTKQGLPSLRVVAGLAGLTVLFMVSLYYAAVQRHMDFAYFYYAFQVIGHKQPSSLLYDLAMQHNWFVQHHLRIYPYNQYVFPPQFAVLLSFFALFPLRTATVMWVSITVFSYLCSVWLLKSVVVRKKSPFVNGLFFLTAVLNFPFWWDLTVGNANTLVFFLVSLSLYLRYARGKRLMAGIPLGLAAVFKVSPEIFILYLLVNREWRFLVGNLLTVAGSTLLTVVVAGIAPLQYYASHFTRFTAMSMENGGTPYNSSLLGLLQTWDRRGFVNLSDAGMHLWFGLYLALVVLVSCLALWQSRRLAHNDVRASLALGVLAILLLAPLVEGPHLMLAFLAGWLAFANWWDNFVHKGQPSTARGRSRPAADWAEVASGIGFTYVALVLSPFDWVLRTHFPAEYFYSLQVLFVLIVTLMVRRRLKFESDLLYG